MQGMIDRHQLAAIFSQMAEFLELSGANTFRIRAYEHGARIVEGLVEIDHLLAKGTLTTVKGIGKGLAAHIMEFSETGTIAELDELRATIPSGVVAMMAIPGVGPKKAKVFWQDLHLTTIEALAKACTAGKVAAVPGMGTRTEAKILAGIDALHKHAGHYLFPTAWAYAERIVAHLQAHAPVQRMAIAGSLRRCNEMVKDIDIVASAKDPAALLQCFVGAEYVERITGHGTTKASVALCGGIHADLRCVDDAVFPFTLHHFTGSKGHNVAMRARAIAMGMKLSEYGLFNVSKGQETLIACKDEAAIFATLGLAYIPPELREDLGEIDAAAEDALPRLIDVDDLCGVFHCHTDASDGKATLEEMVTGAHARGLQYIGISDHSQSAGYAGGLSPARVAQQAKAIAHLQKKIPGIRIFHGIESDILKDGSLDYTDEILGTLDFVIASIHSSFQLPRDAMTARVCRAMRHPAVRMLGHPTGRILLAREPMAIDMDEVLRVAAEEGVVVEINASPKRADLDWRLGRVAQAAGVQTMINPDAHTVEGIDDMQYGVGIARKGWWTKRDVLNTWSLAKVERWLTSRKKP